MVDDKRHQKIKASLSLHQSSLSKIARELQVAPATVSTVSMGYRRSRRIEAAIARAVNATPASIWPEHYPETAQDMMEGTAVP